MKLTIFVLAVMLALLLAAGMLAYHVGFKSGYTESLVRQERARPEDMSTSFRIADPH